MLQAREMRKSKHKVPVVTKHVEHFDLSIFIYIYSAIYILYIYILVYVNINIDIYIIVFVCMHSLRRNVLTEDASLRQGHQTRSPRAAKLRSWPALTGLVQRVHQQLEARKGQEQLELNLLCVPSNCKKAQGGARLHQDVPWN